MAGLDDPKLPAPAPPPDAPANKPAVPLWRSLAEWAGVDDNIDAVADAASRAGHWIQSWQPQATDAQRARYAALKQELDAKHAAVKQANQATWHAVTGPVKDVAAAVGRQLYETAKPAWQVDPGIRSSARLAHEAIGERSAPGREAMAQAGVPGPLQAVIGAQTDWLPNLMVDTVADTSTPFGAASNIDFPVAAGLKAAAAPVLGGAAQLAGGLPPGFFSRVDKVVEAAVGKKGIHPNKLASLLKSGASQEEVAYRNLPDLLTRKGNELISREELAQHLAANPPPQIGRTVLGAETDPAHVYAARDLLARGTSPDDALPALQQAYRGASEATLRDAIDVARGLDPVGPPKYASYALPGGERYQESLTTLPTTPDPLHRQLKWDFRDANLALDDFRRANPDAELEGLAHPEYRQLVLARNRLGEQLTASDRAQAAAQFRSGHFDQPNILTHARTTERALPEGGRGRFLEEVQSDWHQAGKTQGYQDPDKAAVLAAAQARETALETERQSLAGQLAEAHAADDPAYYELSRRRNELGAALAQARTERRALEGGGGVPDAPFKESWPDLALKQQLLDVAHRRDLDWLGFTSGQTQNERYDLAKQVSKIEYDPIEQRLLAYDHGGARVIDEGVAPEEIAEHIGEGPAAKLREQIQRHDAGREWERAQWSTEIDPDTGQFVIVDSNGEVLHNWGGDPELHETEAVALARIDDILTENHETMRRSAARDGDPYLPTLSGLDLQVGGEGMAHFYDQLLPARLNKILKPFGGQVERTTIPGGLGEDVHGTRALGEAFFDAAQPGSLINGQLPVGPSRTLFSRDALGEAFVSGRVSAFDMPNYLQAAVQQRGGVQVPAWIARLSPEMKERLRTQGLPLMSFLPPALAGGAAAAAASQLGGGEEGEGGAGLGGMAALGAALPFMPIKLPRGAGLLANALKRGEGAGHLFRTNAAERIGRLTDFAEAFPRQSNWRGINDPRFVGAFGDDVVEAGRHLRAFAASSPATGVPDNAREAAALQAWRLLHPGQDITHAETRALRGQAMGNAGSKWQNVNDAWNDRVMGRSKYNDALKVESFGNFMHDRLGPLGHPMKRRSRPSDILWTPDRSVPLISLPHDMHMLYGAGGHPEELLDKEWAPLKERLSHWEGLIHPHTGQPLSASQGGFTNKDLYDRVTFALADTLEKQQPGTPFQQSFGRFWTGAQANKLLEQGKKVPFAGGLLDIYGNVGLLEHKALTDPDAIYRALERRKDWYNLGWGPGY